MSNDRDAGQWQPPALGWPELQVRLDALRGNVERMLKEAPGNTDIYGMFAGMAGDIVARSPPELVESVNSELGAILRDLKLTADPMD